ncbi:MAG: FlgD immunoglobulin-like domain containing protein [Bacteroidota bacterium]
MKRTFTLLVLLSLFYFSTIHAQNALRVIDPATFDRTGVPGVIEEASISLQPQGLYTEIGVYLTISAQPQNGLSGEQLEIVLDFNLPSGSIVHDSWLWMLDDETIVQADVFDLWKAISTYEEIVDRQRDPSILYQKETGGHQLRIYPLFQGEYRRIKFTYLVPTVWSAETVESWLPTSLLQTSDTPLESVQLITFPSPTWLEPKIAELTDHEFVPAIDQQLGQVLVMDLDGSTLSQPLHFSVKAPFNDQQVYASKLSHGGDNFYQIAYLPPDIPVTRESKNCLFLFDHVDENADVDTRFLFDYVGKQLQETLQPDDKFNIFYAGNTVPQRYATEWTEAGSDAVLQAFSQLGHPIQSKRNALLDLMREAIVFAKSKGEACEIFLLTNSNDLLYWEATQNAENILDLIDEADIRLHFIPYQSQNYRVTWSWNIGDVTSYQNEVFFQLLVDATGGSMNEGPLYGSTSVWQSVDNTLSKVLLPGMTHELQPQLQTGFTYERFHQHYGGQSQLPNRAILQIGKYQGNFPMELSFNAFADGNFYSEKVQIDAGEVEEGDTLSRKIWMGHHLALLDATAQGNNDIREIIDISKAERVLTPYTAFLALELEQGGEECGACWFFNQEIILNIDDPEETSPDLQLSASPNPFREQTQIAIDWAGQDGPISLQLFDAFGKLIIDVEPSDWSSDGRLRWHWDGTDASGQALPAGVYYLLVKTQNENRNIKLVLVR